MHALIVCKTLTNCCLAIGMQPTKVTMPKNAINAWKKLGLLVVNDKLGGGGVWTAHTIEMPYCRSSTKFLHILVGVVTVAFSLAAAAKKLSLVPRGR